MAALVPTAITRSLGARYIVPVLTWWPNVVAGRSAVAQVRPTIGKPLIPWDVRGFSITRMANGSIYGVVKDAAAAAVPRALIALYYRPTYQLIRSTSTAADGSYRFDGLDPLDTANCFALAFHPSIAAGYNLGAFDTLTPVLTS